MSVCGAQIVRLEYLRLDELAPQALRSAYLLWCALPTVSPYSFPMDSCPYGRDRCLMRLLNQLSLIPNSCFVNLLPLPFFCVSLCRSREAFVARKFPLHAWMATMLRAQRESEGIYLHIEEPGYRARKNFKKYSSGLDRRRSKTGHWALCIQKSKFKLAQPVHCHNP